ncbi:DUF4349 domain-containing protein [Chloroflexota bacterium]
MWRLRTIGVAVIWLVAILLAGCGAEQSAAPSEDYSRGEDEGDAAFAPGAPEPVKDMEESYAEAEEGAPSTTSGASNGADIERMVVRNGSMEVVVDDVMDATKELASIAAMFNGHIVSSSVYEDNGRTYGSVAIRVDADGFDSALEAIRSLSVEVVRENTSSRDVTEEYVDISARKRNLEATEEQLLALMEQAGTVEELLGVQREVSRVRGEIEQLEARIRYLEETTATSLIEVYLREAVLTVSFAADSRYVDEGEPVRFESEVSGGFSPYSYEWDFGDGETSNEASPTHVYEDEGWQSVNLIVTDDKGATENAYRDYYIDVRGVWSPGDVFSDAVGGLGAFGRWLLSAGIWLVVFIPLWAGLAGITYALYRVAKRGRKPKKDQKEA